MLAEIVGVRVSHLTFAWADSYVRKLKIKRNIAPSTIRKRVGVLGRVIDWHLQRAALPGQVPAANVLRLLPTGYACTPAPTRPHWQCKARQGHQARSEARPAPGARR